MSNQISRRRFMTQLGALSAMSGAAIAAPVVRVDAAPNQPLNPDWNHIRRRGRGWMLRPNGIDDTENLEWALRNTAPGGTVKLRRGTFKIGRPVLVPDFDGKLIGAGPRRTTVTCTDIYSYELWEAPGGGMDRGEPKPPPFPRASVEGSSTKSAPMLVSFYKTPLQPGEAPEDRANRIEIRDLRCHGTMAGTPWMFGDEVLCMNIINSFDWFNPEARLETTRQDVVVANVAADGYRTPEFGPFENACACISILGGVVATSNYNLTGDVDGDAFGFINGGLLDVTPAEGDVTITDCVYTNCRYGPSVVGYRDSNLVWENNSTVGCRANCLQVIDVGNCKVKARDNDLHCESFLLPPEFSNGATDLPSSLGCVVAIQGLAAALGFPQNVQWLRLASDPAAHGHPESGPLGTWRPQGPATVPAKSRMVFADNDCESSATPNTYCYHVIDAVNMAFAIPSVDLALRNNSCAGAQTCISLEHVNDGRVRKNECSGQAYGIEVHNSFNNDIARNCFDFPGAACEIRTLSLGEKIDFSRVVPGAGICTPQA